MTRIRYKRENNVYTSTIVLYEKGLCVVIIDDNAKTILIKDCATENPLYENTYNVPLINLKRQVKLILRQLGVDFYDEVRNGKWDI